MIEDYDKALVDFYKGDIDKIKQLLTYFKEDNLASVVWVTKYAQKGDLLPSDMHLRMAREFARVDMKEEYMQVTPWLEHLSPYGKELELIYEDLSQRELTNRYFELFDKFKYVIPQGSVMSILGSEFIASLANCVVLGSPEDSYGGIFEKDEQAAQTMKRRMGVGINLSSLRPAGTSTSNAAKSSTGAVSFMHRFSNTTREVAQCIEENQRVLTDKGLIPIKDIQIGVKVWTKKGFITVEDVLCNGPKEVHKVATKFGHNIITTLDHVFLSSTDKGSKELPLKDIPEGGVVSLLGGVSIKKDLVNLTHTLFVKPERKIKNKYGEYGTMVHNRYSEHNIPKVLDTYLGYLIGYAHGDGYTTKKALSLAVGYKDEDILNKLVSYNQNKAFKTSTSIRKGDGCHVVTVCGTEGVSFLQENGINKPLTEYLRIPEKIWESSYEVQSAYLSGLFDADGYASGKKKGYVFNTVVKLFAEDISTLLLANGILAKIHVEEDRGDNWQDLYSVAIVGAVNQRLFVDFMQESIKVQGCRWVSKRDNYVSPFTACELGIKYNNYDFIPSCENKLSINCLNRYEGYTDEILTEDYIVSKESLGLRNTYDLVLESEHLFWCEGFYVHNSGRRGALMLSLDVNHPDILDFIKVKRDLTQVTGANISVKLNDEFMRAVEEDKDYILRFPCDLRLEEGFASKDLDYNILKETFHLNFKAYYKKIKAKEYWNEIIKSAHSVAEPGLMFWGAMVDYAPDGVYPQYKAETTNPCFRGDMKILTPYGYKTFESLENQECELVNKDGEIVKGTVWCSGEKYIYKIITWNNNYIYCTEDHIFLTIENEEVKAKNLQGERLMPYYSINSEINEYVKLGFLQGDGNLTRLASTTHLGLEINIGEKDLEIRELFGVKTGRSIYLQGYNELLKQLKFSDKKLPERHLPKTFKNWSLKNKQMFFKGMYSANGSIIVNHRVAYKTTCRSLASQIKESLTSWGIASYITTNKEKENLFSNGQYLCKESYDVNISQFESVKLFAEKIGFVHKYKQEALQQLILMKAPKVRSVEFESIGKVYDFNLQDINHWGIVEGVIAHNCSEIAMQAGDACRLIAVNLYSFVVNPFTPEAYFDFDKFYKVNYEAMRLSDNLIDLENEHMDRILEKVSTDPESEDVKAREYKLWQWLKVTSLASRRTGLGFTALGDMIASLGFKYQSQEAQDIVNKVMYSKMKSELDCTTDLAIIRGTFKGWNSELEYPEHEISAEFKSEIYREPANTFYEMLQTDFPKEYERMVIFGRRNVSFSTVAPTGSLSMLTQTTSGVEPVFLISYKRRKKVNTDDKGARIDFVDQNGDSWQEFQVLHPKFKDWIEISTGRKDLENLTEIEVDTYFKISPWYKSTAPDIPWLERVKMQEVIQSKISHSISSTINLSSDVSEQEVSDIYMEAWKRGLKGITVYREGSRSGVLLANTPSKTELTKFNETHAPKRLKSLEAKIIRFNNNKEKWVAFIGTLDDKPYEIFTGKLEGLNLPGNVEDGTIIKVKKEDGAKQYDFIYEGGKIEAISKLSSAEYWNYGKLISGILRHGMPLPYVTDMISELNFEEDHINTWRNGIVRALKKFIKDGTAIGTPCPNPECDGELIFEGGCQVCKSCGHDKCG